MTALIEFFAALLTKLAGPVLAFFAGVEHEKKKEAEQDAEAARQKSQTLEQAARISDSVDLMPDDELERLRKNLNKRP